MHNCRIKLTNIFPWIFFILGVGFVVLAWIKSYPTSIPEVGEFVFNKIYLSLWPGLSIIFASLFLISRSNLNNRVHQLVCTILFVFFLYVHYLFFPLVPGPDSHYFRGLTKLFAQTGVDPIAQGYFQWPLFFIANTILIQILGLNINAISFFTFVFIGFQLALYLFLLYSSESDKLGFIGVALYFLGLFWFLNYQFAPQSLALCFFFLLVNISSRKTRIQLVVSAILFSALVLTHAFIPVFFLISYFILTLFDRDRLNHFLIYLFIYVSFLIYFTVIHFDRVISTLINLYHAFEEYGTYTPVIRRVFRGPVAPFDAIAQFFSRVITITIWLILLTGFVYRILKRDVSLQSLSLLLSGSLYAFIGVFTQILGERAVQIAFASVVSGYKIFLTKYQKLVNFSMLILIILFPFVIMHAIYDFSLVQTLSGELAAQKLIENEISNIKLLASPCDGWYIIGSLPRATNIRLTTWQDVSSLEQLIAESYDYVIYNPKMEKELFYAYGLTYTQVRELRTYFIRTYNRIWDDGYSGILSRMR